MSTKIQKLKIHRKTMQLRLSAENHKRLKLHAVNQQMTMSKMIDKIIDKYFKFINDQQNE